VKLLLDQNLSDRLVEKWSGLFPDSAHVRALGLSAGDDTLIWETAKSGGFAVMSKDDDFRQRSLLFGQPPKVVWLKIGNCSTEEIDKLVLAHADRIREFGADPHSSLLVLTPHASATR
jgi:predicted nuclease of predicted toxin-antitoxin system